MTDKSSVSTTTAEADEAKAWGDGLKLSLDKAKGIPRTGLYAFNDYKNDISQALAVVSQWSDIDPMSVTGFFGLTKKHVRALRSLSIFMMQQVRKSDSLVVDLWKSHKPLSIPEKTSDWLCLLSWMSEESVLVLAQDPRFTLTYTPIHPMTTITSSMATAMKTATPSGDKVAERAPQLAALRKAVTDAIAQPRTKPTKENVNAIAFAVKELTEFEEKEPSTTSVVSSSSSSSSSAAAASCASISTPTGGTTPHASLPLHSKRRDLALYAPHASDAWQALLAILEAGEELPKHIKDVRVTYAEPESAGARATLPTFGEVWSRIAWTKLPTGTELINLGVPWLAHFLEAVQRSIAPLVPSQVEALRNDLRQVKKPKNTGFSDFVIQLQNKVNTFTQATGRQVSGDEKVEILLSAVTPDDDCGVVLRSTYTQLMAVRGRVDFIELVNAVSATTRLLIRTPVPQATAVAVVCSNCGIKNHDATVCRQPGGGAHNPKRASSTTATSSSSSHAGKRDKSRGHDRKGQKKKHEKKEQKGSDADAKSSVCYKCGQDGHWANRCPTRRQKGGKASHGAPATVTSCDKCGGLGHESAECSSSKRGVAAARKALKSEEKEKRRGSGKQPRSENKEPAASAAPPVAEASAPVVEVAFCDDEIETRSVSPVVALPAGRLDATAASILPATTRVYIYRGGRRGALATRQCRRRSIFGFRCRRPRLEPPRIHNESAQSPDTDSGARVRRPRWPIPRPDRRGDTPRTTRQQNHHDGVLLPRSDYVASVRACPLQGRPQGVRCVQMGLRGGPVAGRFGDQTDLPPARVRASWAL